jgi:hypothetical protein
MLQGLVLYSLSSTDCSKCNTIVKRNKLLVNAILAFNRMYFLYLFVNLGMRLFTNLMSDLWYAGFLPGATKSPPGLGATNLLLLLLLLRTF